MLLVAKKNITFLFCIICSHCCYIIFSPLNLVTKYVNIKPLYVTKTRFLWNYILYVCHRLLLFLVIKIKQQIRLNKFYRMNHIVQLTINIWCNWKTILNLPLGDVPAHNSAITFRCFVLEYLSIWYSAKGHLNIICKDSKVGGNNIYCKLYIENALSNFPI